MTSWNTMKTRITASVRTTNRMNALLSESMLSRRRAAQNPEGEVTGGEAGEPRKEKPKNDWKFFHTNFNMERAQKIIEDCIEERLLWDRFSRNYDSWRALQLAEGLAAEIRDRVKKLNHRRYPWIESAATGSSVCCRSWRSRTRASTSACAT
ncbi:uncharacterized protein LOC6607946 isoform X3 [Drosophila sechellia]|uniref:uncharacterized protein LOC6607946 isoform X3 n=1 Tax=Drosophila sechellia TaxID=7238 RepID=UPI0013DE4DAD|nr:uncharacterized protein LOC6607946 isoform X3 [Drosophila sechellia]